MADDDPQDPELPFDAVQAAAEFAAAMAEDPSTDGEAASAGNDRYTALLEDEIATLRAELADKEAALAAAQARASTAVAEVDRVRARIERSAAGTIENNRRSVLASFLDIADAFDRALAGLDDGGVARALAEGVQAIRSELHGVLGRHGAKHRPSKGHPFDPAHHEAIATAPATDDTPAGTIIEVLSEGYVLGDSTLRVARVVVARG